MSGSQHKDPKKGKGGSSLSDAVVAALAKVESPSASKSPSPPASSGAPAADAPASPAPPAAATAPASTSEPVTAEAGCAATQQPGGGVSAPPPPVISAPPPKVVAAASPGPTNGAGGFRRGPGTFADLMQRWHGPAAGAATTRTATTGSS